jgi:hypothetical protein
MQYGVMFLLDAMIDCRSVVLSNKLDSLEQSPARGETSRGAREADLPPSAARINCPQPAKLPELS